ncbi:MAG TPA: tRNA (adenosine(37)-N6)-dimethylallyltransferase MiaA [Longimicrobiales bacterium]|nr:tRNA (adenosine(37)-N6)-dimethylallyltransferase MiaA [Longimicrobiales bacterium]
MAEERPPALALTGPTASGKTALALAIAGRIDAEIISMDSRQVYRGMDIGTAKATAAERARIPHHGLDLVDPGDRYSAGRFARDARRWIRDARARGRVPLLVGGTGFFLRALTRPLFEEPPIDAERRRALDAFLRALPPGNRERWLAALDPESAARLRQGGGAQRAGRVLEVAILTGRPLPWWHAHSPGPAPIQVRVFVLDLPGDRLYDRIDRRVDAMLEAGLVEEVRGLLAAGHRPGDPGMSATGYPEVAAYLAGEVPLEAAVEGIRRATRRYARRQLTWFRHQLPRDAVWLDGTRGTDELAEEVVKEWQAER